MERKKFTALLLAFGLLLFFGGVSFAAKAAHAAKAPKATKVSGEVTAVDANGMTLTLKEKAGKEVTLHVTDKTHIKKGKEEKKLADIKVGEKLSASFQEVDGKMEAKAIQLH